MTFTADAKILGEEDSNKIYEKYQEDIQKAIDSKCL
jgi:hypothetical protein